MAGFQKKISVIVPVYKVEKQIDRCIEYIIKQSFRDFELILIDDGSPDTCPTDCDNYAKKDARIRVIHQQNGGLSDARNKGLEIAIGDWITFIDSDDWVHPDYLKCLYEAATKEKLPIAVGTFAMVDDTTPICDDHIMSKSAYVAVNTEKYWVKHRTNATVAWGKLYDRRLFDAERFPIGKYHEDEFVTYKLLFRFEKIALVKIPIYRYYYNEQSISRLNYMKRFPDVLDCFKQHYAFFKDSPYQKAFRLEVEKYAECLSEAVYLTKNKNKELATLYRNQLKEFLKENKQMIPLEKRKDIYIAAYPVQEVFIRGIGFLKQISSGER